MTAEISTTLTQFAPEGFSLNMHLVRLPGGGVLVHSPIWQGEETWEQVLQLGEPRILFAPNHYHWLSLRRYAERWPQAKVVAGSGALPRLLRKTKLPVRPVADVAEELGAVRLLECEGLKNGETWLVFESAGVKTLAVCDSFFNMERPIAGLMGVFCRATRTSPGLQVGSTFLWLAVRHRPTFRTWALETLERERPTRLLVSHGEPLVGSDVTERLTALVRARV